MKNYKLIDMFADDLVAVDPIKDVDTVDVAEEVVDLGWYKAILVNDPDELEALDCGPGSLLVSQGIGAVMGRNGEWLWADGDYWEPEFPVLVQLVTDQG